MGRTVDFLQRYLAPFLAGVCIAGATVVHAIPVAVLLVLAAGCFGFCSLPVGGQMIRRIVGASI
jgi:hypothetical protein